METTHATRETTNGRSPAPPAQTQQPGSAENQSGRTKSLRIILNESVRRAGDWLVARTVVPARTIARRARARWPRFPHVALAHAEDRLEVHVELAGVKPRDGEVQVTATLKNGTLSLRLTKGKGNASPAQQEQGRLQAAS